MLTGARISSGLSVIGAIVGEFFAGYGTEDFGLGYLIILTNGQAKTDYLFACILFCTLLGLGIFTAVGLLSNFLLKRWTGTPE
jgi:NitT/TauT family transport system permease protein